VSTTLGSTIRKLAIPAALVAVWLIIAVSYYGPADPLSAQEIDAYIAKVERVLAANAVMPEGVGLSADGLAGPLAELRAFAERDDGEPVYMVNMMRWRAGQLLAPEGAGVTGINTPQEADRAYNAGLFWTLLSNYSHTAFLAHAETNAFNYGTGAEADQWGEVGIFRYRSRRDFFEMISSQEYSNILYLKLLSMGAIALVPTRVHGLLLNPMPNVPLVLAAIFLIGYLACLLFRVRLRTKN